MRTCVLRACRRRGRIGLLPHDGAPGRSTAGGRGGPGLLTRLAAHLVRHSERNTLMTTSLSTRAMGEALEDPACVVVDVREMAAFNGWALQHEARGGHLPGAVAFPLEWTSVVQGTALQHVLA